MEKNIVQQISTLQPVDDPTLAAGGDA